MYTYLYTSLDSFIHSFLDSFIYLSIHLFTFINQRQWKEVSSMEMPSEDPHLQMLHLITRAKIYLIYNRHQSDLNGKQGLPRLPIDFNIVMSDFEAADRMLAEGRASSCAIGVCFVKGMLAALTYVRSYGQKLEEALQLLRPFVNHTIRCPGTVRVQPKYVAHT